MDGVHQSGFGVAAAFNKFFKIGSLNTDADLWIDISCLEHLTNNLLFTVCVLAVRSISACRCTPTSGALSSFYKCMCCLRMVWL